MNMINGETYHDVGTTVRLHERMSRYGTNSVWKFFKDKDLIVSERRVNTFDRSFPVVIAQGEFGRDIWIRAKTSWFQALTIQYEDAKMLV